jgi:hypothetical protein
VIRERGRLMGYRREAGRVEAALRCGAPAAPVLPSPLLALLLALAPAVTPLPLAAQERAAPPTHEHAVNESHRATWGMLAIPLLTHAAPAVGGESATEVYLTQPMVMGHLPLGRGRLELTGTLNLEGLTLRRGELNSGVWGEGYFDRRHPHTYTHELLASWWLLRAANAAASVTLGKGFVPFGTDDPMVRGLVKYPANHHLAQILERLVLVGAARRGAVTLEGALFNGDEPTGPGDFASLERFGDSWAARLTARPAGALEAQVSHAHVHSPEHAAGSGLFQRKWSGSLRLEDPGKNLPARYVLMEWARTEERGPHGSHLSLSSWLAEGSLALGPAELALRLERTERAEEERLRDDPFRTPRPHMDVHPLGVTRWTIASAALHAPAWTAGSLRLRPFAELGLAGVRELHGSPFFDPRTFYGADRLWSLSLGSRLEAGTVHPRMGRYAAALPGGPTPSH